MNMFDPTMSMDSASPEFASQRNEFIQGCTGFAAGATAAVLLRLFARWKNSTKLAEDDLSIVLSLLPLWALAGTGVGIAQYGGLAQQYGTLTPSQMSVFYPSAFASYILYALAITGAKLSILLLYRRIFTAQAFRRALYFFMTVCIIWCILVIFLAIFRCSPIPASWNPSGYPNASCINMRNLYYGTASSNVLLDIIINLLPARQIWGLQLPLKQRILLILCMCLGVLSIAAGIGRIATIPSLIDSNLPATIAMPYLFVIIEPSFAIICACLPTYRPLALWVGHGIKNSRYGYRVKSFISSSSMYKSDGTGSKKSRGSGFLFGSGKGQPTPSASEKEVLNSANSTPDALAKGNEFERQWANNHRSMGTRTYVTGGRELGAVPE